MIIVIEGSDPQGPEDPGTPENPNPPEQPPGPPPLRGLGIWFTGVDGSTWDLSDGPVSLPEFAGGEAAAAAGIIGLGDAEVEHKWSEGAVMDGSRWQAMRHLPRQVVLPVTLKHPQSVGFRDLDAAWSDATAPEGECLLTVMTPEGRWRQLVMRRDGTVDSEGYDIDPLLERFATYSCRFVAADPFWRGQTITRSFQSVTQPTFFSPGGSGSVVTIGSSETTAGATIRNPGHVSSWPVYTVEGPAEGFTAGVGDNLIEYDDVDDGQRVIIDTHPTRQTVLTGTGNDAWSGVLERKFAPIPPGLSVPIVVSLADAGDGARITVELTPGYRRAW